MFGFNSRWRYQNSPCPVRVSCAFDGDYGPKLELLDQLPVEESAQLLT
jgi:hypothetical protein